MVQVVHKLHGSYPFGIEEECDHQYVLVLKESLTQIDISSLKQRAKIIKQIVSENLIKVHKVLREDNNLHIIYEYCKISIEQYLQNLKGKYKESIPKESYRLLLNLFKDNVDQLIATLTKYQIKENIKFSNMGCAPSQQQHYVLKYFMDAQTEFLSLNILEQMNKNLKSSQKAKQQLQQFYQTERKSLIIQFQQLCQKYFGYILYENQLKQTPNFVIQGTKLIFVNKQQKKQQIQPQTNVGNKIIETKAPILRFQSNKKEQQKVQNIEKVQKGQKLQKGQRLQKLDKNDKLQKGVKIPQNQKSLVNELIRQNKQKAKQQIIKKNIKPIINFDQSFQPIFRPDQIIKDNTYIVQENQYIQQLQEEIQDLLSNSNKTDHSKNSSKDISKETEKINQKEQKDTPLLSTKGTQKNDNINNSNSYQNSNSSMNQVTSTNNSQTKVNQFGNKTQIKCQRLTKYKMKITTLHQIEINDQKGSNLEEIQQDIMNNIMTGKINMNAILMNEKTNSNNPSVSVTEEKLVKSNSKEVSVGSTYGSILQNQNEQEIESPKNQIIPQQQQKTNGPTPKISKIQNKQIAQLIQNNRLKAQQKVNQSNSIKAQQSVNSLKQQKQKISLNIIKNEPQKTIKTEIPTIKQETNAQQNDEQGNKKVKINKMIEKIVVNHKPASIPPTVVQQKVIIPAVVQKQVIQGKQADVLQKKQNYLQKVREAKSKAEQILKQYTKKKV